MNIYRAELRAARRSTAVWIASLCLLTVTFLLIYPAFTRDVEASRKLLATFPPAVLAMFGLRLDTFFTVYGFFGYLFTFVSLMGAVQASNLGVGSLARDQIAKTTDFLLSKPVGRASILTAKLAASLTLVLLTNIAFSTVAFATASFVSTTPLQLGTFLLVAGTLVVVQVAFVALGTLLSVLVPRIKSIVAVSLPVVFGFYVIGMLDAVIGDADIRYLTPFKYVDVAYAVEHNAWEASYLAVGGGVAVACVVATYVIFARHDIPAAA